MAVELDTLSPKAGQRLRSRPRAQRRNRRVTTARRVGGRWGVTPVPESRGSGTAHRLPAVPTDPEAVRGRER